MAAASCVNATARTLSTTSRASTNAHLRKLASPAARVNPAAGSGSRRNTIAMAMTPARVEKSETQWKEELDPTSFQVLRRKGTEPAGTGEYDKFYPDEGHFVCKGCGNPLYSADSKFNSGCGWPAFDKCYKGGVKTETDTTFGMKRIEILCAACDGHLGHVFENEGLTPTMERHCVNSVSVKFVPTPPAEALEEAKVSNGEGGGGLLSQAIYPLLVFGVVYAGSGLLGKVVEFFTSSR